MYSIDVSGKGIIRKAKATIRLNPFVANGVYIH